MTLNKISASIALLLASDDDYRGSGRIKKVCSICGGTTAECLC